MFRHHRCVRGRLTTAGRFAVENAQRVRRVAASAVVAEGVESRTVWDRLGALGCDIPQGFAIARPMPFDELRVWLGDHARSMADTADTIDTIVTLGPIAADEHLPRANRLEIPVP